MKTLDGKYEVHNDINDWHWYTKIRGSVGYRLFEVEVKSRKWSVTGLWMPANIHWDKDFLTSYLSKEDLLSFIDTLIFAYKIAANMDDENKPLGPTEV